jgi:ribonucleoside-triphosphate reductase
MKVIKRDGRAVEFDKQKICVAIQKANGEVRKKERASEEEINSIISYIEELDKKRILVEDIQDIIEEKLMDAKKFELAKKYIVYRYTRALVRKQNTTDESILGLIKNTNKEKCRYSFNTKRPNCRRGFKRLNKENFVT